MLPACLPAHWMQVATLTVVEVQSKTPDPRIAAWQGQQLAVLLCAYANCTAYQNGTVGEQFRAAALDLVTKMDYCALADDNIVGMKVWLGLNWGGKPAAGLGASSRGVVAGCGARRTAAARSITCPFVSAGAARHPCRCVWTRWHPCRWTGRQRRQALPLALWAL